MDGFVAACRKVGGWMEAAAGVLVFLMMALTVADVALRYFGHPIFGSFEWISLMSAMVIGLAMPKTSLDRGHVEVDLLTAQRSRATRRLLAVSTRLLGIALFCALTWFLVGKGIEAQQRGVVSAILQMPQHYLVFALAACALAQCVALAADLVVRWQEARP